MPMYADLGDLATAPRNIAPGPQTSTEIPGYQYTDHPLNPRGGEAQNRAYEYQSGARQARQIPGSPIDPRPNPRDENKVGGYPLNPDDPRNVPGTDGETGEREDSNKQIRAKMRNEEGAFTPNYDVKVGRPKQGREMVPQQPLDRQYDGPYSDSTNPQPLIEAIKGELRKLRDVDFAFLKYLGHYPNNRLMILRRFDVGATDGDNRALNLAGVGDNLDVNKGLVKRQGFYGIQGTNEAPLSATYMHDTRLVSTVVTWVKPEESNLFTVNYQEKWRDESKHLFEALSEIFKATGADKLIEGISKITGLSSKLGKFNPFGSDLGIAATVKLLKAAGFVCDHKQLHDIIGNPNLIREASIRDYNPDNHESGFLTNILYKVEVEYVVRSYKGMSEGEVMLDILSNLIRMGVQDAHFSFNTKTAVSFLRGTDSLVIGKGAGDILNSMLQFIKNLINSIKEAIQKSFEGDLSVAKLAEGIADIGNEILRGVFAKHRINLAAAIAATSGTPTGYWHLTIGNPLKPIISQGNLVPGSTANIELKNELSNDDWPTEIKAAFNLKNGRSMGAQEIESIFTSGTGRIFTKLNHPDHLQKDNAGTPDNTCV